jgi:transcriptional regulator with GAF, ATPase, and Fis domain
MFEEIVGSSPALQAVLANVAKITLSDPTVLITGETGTGKELIARAVHKRSARSARAFVGVNCAAIPQDLIASESFGHEREHLRTQRNGVWAASRQQTGAQFSWIDG